jgi:hypothetical protein
MRLSLQDLQLRCMQGSADRLTCQKALIKTFHQPGCGSVVHFPQTGDHSPGAGRQQGSAETNGSAPAPPA